MEKLYIIVPCYNEEEVLPETARRLDEKLARLTGDGQIAQESRVVFVDDGSKDRTWEIISSLHTQNARFGGVKLSRNEGHQNALLAGLLTTQDEADWFITMDADLQDDIDAIDRFLEKAREGCEVVYGVRSSRESDTFFKRESALTFYRVMKAMGVDLVYNHADYRLMSRRAVQALGQFREVNLFLRGIVPLVGFKSATVAYERHERFAGESKYPLRKMLAFALEGVTSFSIKPIRCITILGLVIFLVSIVILIYSLAVHLFGRTTVGWTSTVTSIWAIGGLQILSIGVIGEYIGKIYLESKARPKYFVETYLK